jgi:Mg/Co/Ni transporter MgtE
MYLSIFGYPSFLVLVITQLIFYSTIFQPIYGLQTDNLNQSSAITDLQQEQEDDRASIFNEPDSPRANPGELKLKENTLTPELAAKELSNLNSSQITEYPLQELSSDDVLATFNLVSDETLEKVLTNIKPENLKIIFDKILPFYYESIFERLSPQTQNYVLDNTGKQGISS